MIGFELYTLFICILVFVALTVFFAFMIFYIGKQKISMIESGIVDEAIIKSQSKKKDRERKRCKRCLDILSKIASACIFVSLCAIFVVVGVSSGYGEGVVGDIPAIKVVSSTSMSEKYENNTYLFKNNLNNQLQLFDLVVLHKLPAEEDIMLYDIVVYEHISGALLLHRIVGIEEPNELHPNERYFLLQGDAVHYPDTFPVRYEQMKSIYDGMRLPNVGSFVFFMQSPAGSICLILILCSMVLMPIADGIVAKKERERYQVLMAQAVGAAIEDTEVIELVDIDPEAENEEAEDAQEADGGVWKQGIGRLSLKQRLQKNDVARLRYLMIKPSIESIEGVRMIEGKSAYTYKKGNRPIVKVTVVGKTLNIYFALKPEEFADTKYKFIDVSNIKKFKNYPMRVKITSDRQMKWATELAGILKKKIDL